MDALKYDSGRLNFIDSLRGLAALYVVVFHVALVPKFKPIIPALISPIILNGGTGVSLFFVISSFTLCLTYKGKSSEKYGLLSYYIRRGFRIIPLYYVWLLVMCSMAFDQNLLSGLWLNKKSVMLYALFGFNFFPGKQEGIVWASWTLGVEMVFYLFFPLIFRLCKNVRRSILFLVISLILAWIHWHLTRNIPNYEYGLGILHHLPTFAIGIICFNLVEGLKQNPINYKIGTLLIIVSLIVIVFFPYSRPSEIFLSNYAMSSAFGALLIGLYLRPIRIIVNRVTVFFGLISYSLYLNHPQLINYMTNVYKNIYMRLHSSSLAFLASSLITIIPLTILSILTYLIIEKPGIGLGRRIIRNLKTKDEKWLKFI